MVLCFVYTCNHNSLWESWKFYRFRIRAKYACTRPCTSRVHGPCTRPCTVYTARTQPSTRPRTRPVHDRTRRRCIRLYVHGPYTGVHGSHTAVTRPYTGREGYMTMYTAVYKPCTWSCTSVYGPYMTVDTARIHNRVHGTYRAVYGPCTLNNN